MAERRDSRRRSGGDGSKEAGDPSRGASQPVQDRILDRTIYLMGQLGTTDVPVRAIAREAGVNVAAVNYYFASKEQMLLQLAERFRVGFEEVMNLLSGPGVPAEDRIRRWAAEIMRYLAEYPGFLPLMERQMAAEPRDAFGEALRGAMQRAVEQLLHALREMVGEGDEQRLAFKLTLLASMLAGPFPRHLDPEAKGTRRQSKARRDAFLDLLLEHLKE